MKAQVGRQRDPHQEGSADVPARGCKPKDIGGIQNMTALPDAMFVIDVGYHKIAVLEAKKLNIPVIGVVDSNHLADRDRLRDSGQRPDSSRRSRAGPWRRSARSRRPARCSKQSRPPTSDVRRVGDDRRRRRTKDSAQRRTGRGQAITPEDMAAQAWSANYAPDDAPMGTSLTGGGDMDKGPFLLRFKLGGNQRQGEITGSPPKAS